MAARVSRLFAGTAFVGAGTAAAASIAALANGHSSPSLVLSNFDDTLRPAVAALLPAEAFVCLYSAARTPFLQALSIESEAEQAGSAPAQTTARTSNLRALGLSFRNDLGNAAGLDKDGSLLDFNYSLGAGFTVVGTVLSESHTGNLFSFFGGLWSGNVWTPLPKSGATLNSLGLPSKGVDAALENIAAFRERHGMPAQCARDRRKCAATNGAEAGRTSADFPIGVSIMGHPAHGDDPAKKLEGVLYCVRRSLPLADFIEINESCPNVHHSNVRHGGGGGAANDQLATRLKAVVAVRDAAAKEDPAGRRVPILVKLGDLGEPKATIKFLAGLGVDGVVALNTQKDYEAFDLPAADKALLQHYTARFGGGLSGPPILDRSTAQVTAAQAAVHALGLDGAFTVIHVGGIQSVADMQRSRATGAELRQWYTGLMHGIAQPDPYSLYKRLTAR